jgi:transcription elongation factor Elf1
METKIVSEKYFKVLETYLMNDQPFTCPHCGSRCEEIANFSHTNNKVVIQMCLNEKCGFICYEEEDEYFLKLWGVI